MISYIIGEVAEIADGAVVVECNSMGYLINVSNATITRLSQGDTIKLHTAMQIRENDLSLIGFLTKEDAKIFDMLVSVSGVGTKAALAIQSVLDASQVILAILTEEADELCRAQGVGKKLASRIVLELKDKLKSSETFAHHVTPQQSLATGNGDAKQDAVDALLALGYSRAESLRAVMSIDLDGMSSEQIIRQALRKLAVN
ncbi:MAG: Holliday junction branch migration protein RuvA [Defluviitaleaceae bacterium]|nr:Holliday junction branch migration protein RuvA [Defluviitaleaceae bacterium]